MDQREDALAAGHITTLRDRPPKAIYNGVERRRGNRVTHSASPTADREAKMRAWQNTLEKAAGIMKAHGHHGDAATLEDISRMLGGIKP